MKNLATIMMKKVCVDINVVEVFVWSVDHVI